MDFTDQTFSPDTELPADWQGHEFDGCTFKNLNLAGALLAGAHFADCTFAACNLANARLKGTRLLKVRFADCKLTGTDFGACSPFGFEVGFQKCLLDLAIFLGNSLKKARFVACSLKEASLMRCNATGALFDNCDLHLAQFSECNLTQADFTSSYNIRINPDDNRIQKAKFSLHALPGLLDKYNLTIS